MEKKVSDVEIDEKVKICRGRSEAEDLFWGLDNCWPISSESRRVP